MEQRGNQKKSGLPGGDRHQPRVGAALEKAPCGSQLRGQPLWVRVLPGSGAVGCQLQRRLQRTPSRRLGGGQSRRAWKDLKQVTIRFKQLLCSAERAEMFQTDANLDMCGTYNKLFNVF